MRLVPLYVPEPMLMTTKADYGKVPKYLQTIKSQINTEVGGCTS
jgi:hypothetical protein